MSTSTALVTTALTPKSVVNLQAVVDEIVERTTDSLAQEDSARLIKAAQYILKTSTVFKPEDHLTNIGSSNKPNMYLPVQWRLVWYRQECPAGTIDTEIVFVDLDKEHTAERFRWVDRKKQAYNVTAPGMCIIKATITDGAGGRATGTAKETAAAFDDFIEKCETRAIGRALAALGYGTQFVDDEELSTGHHIVDSGVAPR